MDITPLLLTKFYVPRTRQARVARARLASQLEENLDRRLTLVSAPAGFGKTTLVAEWVAARQAPVAWLSLDDNDNDIIRFLTYLITALKSVDEAMVNGLFVLLQSLEPPQTEDFLTALINQIHDLNATGEPCVLVLDDYHVISEKSIHEALVFLIDHLPSQLRLIIITRADPPMPLARMRGRGHLAETRQADLCFTSEEALEYLNQIMGLSITQQDVDALNRHTEGWIVGLQMAAISMSELADSSNFIQEFTGSNRYILDYLVEEVLERQPPSVQTFLQETAVLQRMCAPLCDVMLEWDEDLSESRNAQDVLEYLERANLFVVPLDDHREWYRYHHLFAELLIQRLEYQRPQEIVRMHCLASEWFEQQHMFVEAIHHALAAGEYDRAAGLIESQAENFLMRSEFSTVLAWCRQLPEDTRNRRPLLRTYFALSILLAGRSLDEVDQGFGDAVSDETVDRLEVGMVLYQAIQKIFHGDVQRSVELTMHALESLPEDSLFLRGLANRNLGTAYLMIGDVTAASQIFEQDVQMSQRGNDKVGSIVGYQRLAASRTIQGLLHEAYNYNRKAVDLAVDARGNWLPVSVKALAGLGDNLREWDDLEKAEYYAQQSIEEAKRWSIAYGIAGYLVLTRIKQSQGDPEGACKVMERVKQIAYDYDATDLDDIIVNAFQARLMCMLGDWDTGMHWAQQRGLDQLVNSDIDISAAEGLRHMYHVRELEDMVLARLCLAHDLPERALKLLQPLSENADRLGRGGSKIEVGILQARAYQQRGDLDQAMEFLGAALVAAEPEGYTRIFLDEGQPVAQLLYEATCRNLSPVYAGRLLASMELEASETQHRTLSDHDPVALIEPLSEREIQVLQLISEGLSNREIAQKLYLSTSTIKAHTYSIYGKLDVHSRTQAVARARTLGILPSAVPLN